ncbi:MAG: hypothetical protein ACI38Y_08235 [Candidatus Methanomethylophilaceae archaeon]
MYEINQASSFTLPKQSASGEYNLRYDNLPQSSSCDTITFNKLKEYRFLEDVYFSRVIDKDGFVHLSNKEADLFACGRNDEEAEEDLYDELDFAWNEYVLQNPDPFHQSAINYRGWLIDNIERSRR